VTVSARGLLWPLHRWLEAGTLLLFRVELARLRQASRRGELQSAWVGAEGLDDLLALCALAPGHRGWPARQRLLEARLARGARPFLLRDQDTGRPLHVRWVTRQPEWVPECGRWLCPGPGEAYLFDAFTAPDARGRGLSGHARRLMAARLQAEGLERAFWYVLEHNRPSLRSVPVEAVRAQEVRFVRLGAPARPWLAAPLGEPAAPLRRQPVGPHRDPGQSCRSAITPKWSLG
jgi:RimJ/RimL family protein N-acetyltransferase